MSLDETNVVPLPVKFKPHAIETPRRPMNKLAALAAVHGDAFDIALGKSDSLRRMFVCDSLRLELAAKIVGLAEQCYALADQAKGLSEIATCANLKIEAEHIEYIAGILTPLPENHE